MLLDCCRARNEELSGVRWTNGDAGPRWIWSGTYFRREDCALAQTTTAHRQSSAGTRIPRCEGTFSIGLVQVRRRLRRLDWLSGRLPLPL